MSRARAAALFATVALGLATMAPIVGATVARPKPDGSITVFAASSLTKAFTKIGADFERTNPGTAISFNFTASSTLATQIEQGAPADVFASADPDNMTKLVHAGAITAKPVTFARNRLAIAVERANPLKIRSLADTVKSDVTLVLCAAAVPCGKYALESYAKAGVRVPTVPTAESAKATLNKVSLGEADAAVVYVTDVAAAGTEVARVTIPKRDNVVATYPIGVLAGTQNRPLANAFAAYVASPGAQRTLQRLGFLRP